MPLFSVCPQCGKKKLFFYMASSGLCNTCQVKRDMESNQLAQEQCPTGKQSTAQNRSKVEQSYVQEREDIIARVSLRQSTQMGLRRAWGPRAYGVLSDYTVIDTETTGLDACTCEILEIGAIRYRSHREVARFRSYIRPYRPIPRSATEINGITEYTVKLAPRFPEVYADLLDFIGDDVLIGYNIDFDIKFIQTRAGEDIKNKIFDVLPLAKQALTLERYRLDDLRAYFLIGGGSHAALDDCKATAKVYQRLIDMPNVAKQLAEEAAREEAAQKEYERLRQEQEAHLQKVKDEKARLMANAPSAKELRQLSAKMTGEAIEYLSKAKMILKYAGIDTSRIGETYAGDKCKALHVPCKNDIFIAQCQIAIFFGVKLEGNLKYILLDLPPEDIKCDFVCVPSSIQEGENRSRIYIPSVQAMDSIAEYIVKSYQHAQETVNNQKM